MNVLIVHAHPEPRSFTAALCDTARSVLAEEGHTVTVSDLYAQGFDPAAKRGDFSTAADPEHFRYNREGGAAMARGTEINRFAGFVPELAEEMRRLDAADLVIFTTPVWWFSLPAILKGWVDKVLALNFAYGHTATYETGPLKGKRALLALTTGGPGDWYQREGQNGTLETNFYPVHHGVFWYCGMTVLEPFAAFAVGRSDDSVRAGYLKEWSRRLRTLDDARILYPAPR